MGCRGRDWVQGVVLGAREGAPAESWMKGVTGGLRWHLTDITSEEDGGFWTGHMT